MENPECNVDDILPYIKGPDFPTAALIYGTRGIREAYETGKGRIYVRARGTIDEEHRRIVFTEIPYMVNKALLIESIANLYKEKKIEGISGLRDESGRGGMRIVVEYKKEANGEVIMNQLYKYTQLQDTCSVNMLVIDGGEPKILPLLSILDNYIAFQKSVIVKRTQFDLDKALKELHILEGYRIATDNIDEVIEIIKKSESIPAAKESLKERFGLSDEQAQAIVDMTLGKLSGLERQKVEDRIEKLTAIVADLRDILESEGRVEEILKNELTEIKTKFGDKRRTEIVEATEEIDLEDLIERHTCVITMSHTGYIKRQRADTYTAQNRGGKGIIGMTTKEDDYVENLIVVDSHSTLLFFTNFGKVYAKKAYRIPEASRTAKGSNIVNILDVEKDEKVTAILPVTEFNEGEYLTMITRFGVIKRTRLTDFSYQRKGGKIAITLDEGDELLFVRHTAGGENLLIATKDGNAVRFTEENVRVMGRGARGVRGITLSDGDEVVGVAVVDDTKMLLTITEKGLGKRTPFSEFREMKNRGGHGIICHHITERSGKLSSIAAVAEDDDVMLITDEGTIIRIPVSGINVYSRGASGIIVMRLAEGSSIIHFARIEKEEEIERESETIDKTIAESPKPAPEREALDDDTDEEPTDDGEGSEE